MEKKMKKNLEKKNRVSKNSRDKKNGNKIII